MIAVLVKEVQTLKASNKLFYRQIGDKFAKYTLKIANLTNLCALYIIRSSIPLSYSPIIPFIHLIRELKHSTTVL